MVGDSAAQSSSHQCLSCCCCLRSRQQEMKGGKEGFLTLFYCCSIETRKLIHLLKVMKSAASPTKAWLIFWTLSSCLMVVSTFYLTVSGMKEERNSFLKYSLEKAEVCIKFLGFIIQDHCRWEEKIRFKVIKVEEVSCSHCWHTFCISLPTGSVTPIDAGWVIGNATHSLDSRAPCLHLLSSI